MKTSTHNYGLLDYESMVGARSLPRVEAHCAAIERAVSPGSVVLEIGSGPGVFALVAARAGARKVYSVDLSDTVRLGPALARANGLADRIEFQQLSSLDLVLPEPADVIVLDLRGGLPLMPNHLDAIRDARARHLKPGGTLIPGRDTLWAAVVTQPFQHARRRWAPAREVTGLDLSPLSKFTLNQIGKCQAKPEDLCTPPQCWGELDYAALLGETVGGELSWTVERAGAADGLAVWFDCELVPGLGFSNAPSAPGIAVYSQTFIPWERSVDVAPGDRVKVALRAARPPSSHYEWSWRTQVRRGGSLLAEFNQASFAARGFLALPI